MANIWEKAISILMGKLNSGLSYLIRTVSQSASLNWSYLSEERSKTEGKSLTQQLFTLKIHVEVKI